MTHKTPDTSIAVYGVGGERYLELIRRFPLRRIRTEAELDAATEVIHSLIDKETLTPPEDDYLDVLSDLVIAYEEVHYPDEPVTDADMIRHFLDTRELTQARLAKGAGIVESTISEVISGKRKLTRGQIGKLARFLHVEPGVFAFEG